jgi:hypothetical protein
MRNFPWFSVVMSLILVAFISVCVFLVVRETNADADFRRRCAKQDGLVISEDGDQLRVCVDRDRRVILVER